MKRFLSTTAVLLTMSGAAYADAHANNFGSVTAQESDFFASDLIGMRIYNSEAEMAADATIADGGEQEWDDLGEINDIIISQEGDVTAVILGVGGFLGIGERDVSVSMDQIKIVREEGDSNDRFLVVNTSKEMLEQAPEFERPMVEAMDNTAAATDEMATDAEAKTEELAADAEAETEELAADAEAKTEELAADAEAETDEMVAETEAATNGIATETEMAAGDAERELLPRPEVEREGYAAAEAEMINKLTAEDIQGSYVYGANDETVGEIDSLVMSDDGKVEQVVINVGGFLGLGEKPVAVTFDELQVLKNVDGDDLRIYIDSTEEKLEALPEYQQ